ncbi:Trigger factor [Patescibacteria group bacterium]|nr:hypothetical protein [Candidatus Dojkabacteria bacterium]CAG1022206.1 Trigger factor [Patescibacteria group bacterium]
MDNLNFKRLETDRNKLVYQVTVDYSDYQKYEDHAYEHEAKKIKVPGFRPGQAPKEMVEKEVASKVFSHAVNELLPTYAEAVLVKENLSPISHLHYDLKELDKEKGVIFTFEVITQPEINPEDFKKIKVEEPNSEVDEKEIEEVIKNMIKNNLPADKIPAKKATKKDVDTKEEDPDKQVDFEITDELVAELNYDGTKTVSELKANVKEALESLKKQQSESEFTSKVLEEAIKIADFHVPHEMIDDQVAGLEEDFKARLRQIKLSIENYIKTQGTTIEEMRGHWEKDAKQRISSDLLLVNLAVKEGLVATEPEVEAEIEKMEDKNLRARYQNQSNKDYLRTIMTRERGLTRLVDIVRGK